MKKITLILSLCFAVSGMLLTSCQSKPPTEPCKPDDMSKPCMPDDMCTPCTPDDPSKHMDDVPTPPPPPKPAKKY